MEKNNSAEIFGWDAVDIEEDMYLVSFTYTEKPDTEVGYYFEVKPQSNIVRNIFANTPLFDRYKDYAINPVHKLVGNSIDWAP